MDASLATQQEIISGDTRLSFMATLMLNFVKRLKPKAQFLLVNHLVNHSRLLLIRLGNHSRKFLITWVIIRGCG